MAESFLEQLNDPLIFTCMMAAAIPCCWRELRHMAIILVWCC